MSVNYNQWIRKISLTIASSKEVIDLSEFRIHFVTQNADLETPNNAAIRVYNLSQDTITKLTKLGEFSEVNLQAGYQEGAYTQNTSDMGPNPMVNAANYGAIFAGTVKQYRIGRENAKDTYLDIFASDGDVIYNQGKVNQSIAAGATPSDVAKEAVKQAAESVGLADAAAIAAELAAALGGSDTAHTPNIRGTVLYGLWASKQRDLAQTLDFSWSIQNGKVVMIPFKGYLPNEAVVINSLTGMIGMPEQTDGGIKIRCLLNPKLRIGGLIQMNEKDINQRVQAHPDMLPIPYNQRVGFQFNTPLSKNGFYRAYVVEHTGDTRGQEWYTDIIALAADVSNGTVVDTNG